MLKIALCDDNRKDANLYAGFIKQVALEHQIQIELSCFYKGDDLLLRYENKLEELDIVYMDICMDQMDGMETARELRARNCKAQIVFLTGCKTYVYEAFEVNAVHYLIKGDTPSPKFEKVFLKAAELASKKGNAVFSFEFGGRKDIVPIRDIVYLGIKGRVVTIHYDNGKKGKFYGSMSQLEGKLADYDFARPHRSFLVHLPYITMFRRQELMLKTGEVVPIELMYEQPLKEAFAGYISDYSI